jgi:hypothetical protein
MILELFIELKLTKQVYNSQEGSVRCEDDSSSHLENVKLFVCPSQCTKLAALKMIKRESLTLSKTTW